MRVILALFLTSVAGAQTPGNLPARRIGPNDLLTVTVYGAPELSRTIRVGSDGLLRMPMLPRQIEAGGLEPVELERILAGALSAGQILVDPDVTVTIAQYASRPVSVVGAVRRPLTFEPSGGTTLIEALARAEGLNQEAGPELLLTHPPATPGAKPLTQRIAIKDLMDPAENSPPIVLQGGEEVRVPQAGRVFVAGSVKHPGAFRLEEGKELTLLKALALAEGLAPYSGKEAYIYRLADSGRKEIAIPLRKIIDRKSPDVTLLADDILYVPDNRQGRVTASVVEKALSFAVGTASGALILGFNR